MNRHGKHRARTGGAGRSVVALVASLVLVLSSALAVTASASTPGGSDAGSTAAAVTTTGETDGTAEQSAATTGRVTGPAAKGADNTQQGTDDTAVNGADNTQQGTDDTGPAAEGTDNTQPAAEASATVGVTKSIVGDTSTFAPGERFTYDILYTCSSQTDPGCYDATVTDLLPAGVVFDSPVTLGTDPATWSQETVTVDGQERLKITVTFTADLGGGQTGLAVGRTGHINVTVHFPDGTPDGTVAHNCANIAASNAAAAAESCADATSTIVPSYGVDLTKSYTAPYEGDSAVSGVQGTDPTSTLNLSATVGGNQPATSVTVTDPDPHKTASNDPFDSFDLTGINQLHLPDGVQAEIRVKSTGDYVTVGSATDGQSVTLPGDSGIDAADVTGIQVVYTRTDGEPIAAGTTLTLTAGVQLRDTLRSDAGQAVPVGTVPNQAAVTASYPDHGDETDTDTADYTVVARSAKVQAGKQISPSSAQQYSGDTVAMTVSGKNTGNVDANGMIVTDPDPNGDASAFDTFAFSGFHSLSLPAGVTATVQVLVNGDWITVEAEMSDGDTPIVPAAQRPDVAGVQYLYSGPIPPGTTISNTFDTTLRDDATTGSLQPANCVAVSMGTEHGTGAAQSNACANFTVVPVSKSISAGKSFDPTKGTAGTGAQTTVTLTGTNTSNVPIDDFMLSEPGDDPEVNTFGKFDFSGFGAITAPSGTTWTVQVDNGTTWQTVGTYAAGDTPAVGELPSDADDVQGVRYILESGSIPAGSQAIRTAIDLTLRDTDRASGGQGDPITAGTVTNCVTASSDGITDAHHCADYTIDDLDRGTGTGVGKNIVKSSVVQDTGEATDVLLTGKNGANAPVTTIVLEDRNGIDTDHNGANTFWDSFEFNGFRHTAWPTGATGLKVEYFDGSGWHVVGDYTAAGTPSLPDGVHNADVQGLRYTWTGQFAPGAAVSARFSATVQDGAAAETVRDCVQQRYSGGLITSPVVSSACDTIDIDVQSPSVHQAKSFDPPVGTLGLDPAATTTAWLTVKNTGNVGLDQIVVTDPNGDTNPFEKFTLVGFPSPGVPGHDRVDVAVSTDGGTTWTSIITDVWNNGNIPTPANAADVNAVKFTLHPNPAQADQIRPDDTFRLGIALQLRDTVRGTGDPVTTDEIENCFATAATPAATLSGRPCATFTPQANTPGVAAGKTWVPASGVRDELPSSTITMKGANFSGNVPLDALAIQDPAAVHGTVPAVGDTAFDYLTVTGLSGLVFPPGADRVRIDVLTSDGTWHRGEQETALPTGEEINGVALAEIVGVRATFSNATGGTLPVVSNAGTTGNVGIDVALRSTLRSTGEAIDVAPGGTVTVDNTSSAIGYVGDTPTGPATADASYTITSGAVRVEPDKSLYPAGSTGNAGPDSPVTYRLQIRNTGDRNLVAPVVLDSFDPTLLRYEPTLDYPRGKYEFVGNDSSLTGEDLAVDYDADAGTVTFRFAEGDYLAPGETAYLKIVLYTQPGLPAGTTITNTYGVTWDVDVNGPIACTTGQQDIDGTTYCTDTEPVKISKAQAMGSVKWIKGDDVAPTNVVTAGNPCPADSSLPGYTKYPCIAHTHTGGIFDYTLRVTVTGNVSIGSARVVDVLPHVGDTGLIDTRNRDTEWTPTMHSEIEVTGLPDGAQATVYYSTVDRPCDAPTQPLDDPTQDWCADWSEDVPEDLATVTAIGVQVVAADGEPLQPAQAFDLHWQMKAPAVAPGGDSQYYPDAEAGPIAWNSFAFTGLPTDGSGWLLPAEPNKVGIDLTNPSVQVTKTTAGGDGAFEFTLTPADPDTHEPIGDPLPADVSTTDGAGSATWGSPDYALTPGGTYTLAETSQDAWAAQFGACTNRGEPITPVDSGAAFVTFVAPPNGHVSCSFDNTKRPIVTVEKTATGAGGTFSFTLQPTDPAGEAITEDLTVDADQTGAVPFGPAGLLPGSYTLTETVQGEWVSDFVQCTVGDEPIGETLTDGRTGVSFTAAAGDEISCAFTNTKRPGITVVKTATGGPGTFAFTLTGEDDATGGGTVELAVSDGGTATHTWGPDGLTPGGTYTLTETVDDGWISTFQQCTGVDPTAHTDRSVTFVAEAGAEISCAFSNTKRPQITIEKTTVGGESGSFPFELRGPGGSVKTVDVTDGTGSATWGPEGLEPGEYLLYEDTTASVDGWDAQIGQCVDATGDPVTTTGAMKGPDGAGVILNVEAGQDVTCSFTNLQRPTITVAKATDGGDGTFGFTLTPVDPTGDAADGPMTQDVTTTDGSGSATWGPAGLTPGGTYTLTETGDADWISTFVQCVDLSDPAAGEFAFTALADPQVGAQFTAEPGAQIVCSFRNTERPVVLVQKTTVGGSDGEFGFVLDGVGGSTQQVTVTDGTGTASWGPAGLEPGDYTLREDTTGVSDRWVTQFEQCTALGSDDPVGTATDDGTGVALTLAAGATVVCSFTNTARPTISVAKTTDGGDGTFEFTLTPVDPAGDAADGPMTQHVTTTDGSGSATWGPEYLVPGATYTLTETEQTGWTGEITGCTVDGEPADVPVDGLSVTFTAPAGADIECAFRNTTIQVLPTSSSVPPPSSSDTPAPPTSPSITVLPTASNPGSSIAYTGVDTAGMGWVALLLLAGGGLLLGAGALLKRRPRRH